MLINEEFIINVKVGDRAGISCEPVANGEVILWACGSRPASQGIGRWEGIRIGTFMI